MLTQAPKGTRDIFGEEVALWQDIEQKMRTICKNFGIEEIRTPVFEHTELFLRGVGETTDIVQKEMYTFMDKGDRSITLRPEGTAGVARAYIEHGMHNNPKPVKLYYINSTFRYENTQAGRQRQFNQFGIEMLGSYEASEDAEVISVAYRLLTELGIKNVKLYLNSLGCPACREKYNEMLKSYIRQNLSGLCKTCRERFEKNPLRVLDCKEEGCLNILSGAPLVLDCLCGECKEHFGEVQSILSEMGIEYEINPKIVRGLDYYTRTVFEFVTDSIGAQGTVCGGGRYDNLIEECGGEPTGAVGFGLGIERLILTLKAEAGELRYNPKRDIFIGSIGKRGAIKAMGMTYDLRSNGIMADCDTMGRSVKAQMKYADKLGSRYSFIIGDNEIDSNSVVLKNMETGEKKELNLSDVSEKISEIL
ncbi:MAG: histidine--tRNA ligase [Lachnospiraceae bacterium]|nr:histidine--tRNA ligase [Lachnospiraceae bacterium]